MSLNRPAPIGREGTGCTSISFAGGDSFAGAEMIREFVFGFTGVLLAALAAGQDVALPAVIIPAVIAPTSIKPTAVLITANSPVADPSIFQSNTWQSKLRFHAISAFGPDALVASIAIAGVLQARDFPGKWGQGASGYGMRVGSTLAFTGTRNLLGFGLDTALHQDPRYYRLGNTGSSGRSDFWPRAKHAIRGTILARKDSGGETLATWRFGSAYGAALLSNEWYPGKLNTMKLGMARGSTQIGFDLLGNLGTEFWPDIRKSLFHRKP